MSNGLHFNRWEHSQNFPHQQPIDLSSLGGSISLSRYSSYDDEKVESSGSSLKKIQSSSRSNGRIDLQIQRVNSKQKESNNFNSASISKVENKEDEHDLNDFGSSIDHQFEKDIRSPSGRFRISRTGATISPRRRNQQDTSTSSPFNVTIRL